MFIKLLLISLLILLSLNASEKREIDLNSLVKVVEFINPKVMDIENKVEFNNYKFSKNIVNIDSSGITLIAREVKNKNSKIRGSLKEYSKNTIGIAVEIITSDLDNQRKNRIGICIKGYNDGRQNIVPIVRVLKDKIIYCQWQTKKKKPLSKWITILDNADFSNKKVTIALWIKNSKLHFYAKYNDRIGYKTFDISNYVNNPVDGKYWFKFGVEARKNSSMPTKAKFIKIYTLE